MEKIKKAELTKFAKDCAWGSRALINGICMSEELVHSDLGHRISNGFVENNKELIFEISKRFAKYANDTIAPEIEGGDLQDFCRIIGILVNCCEEHDWFM